MKKLVAYCLLIAFGVLLTPRGFWHECDDHHLFEQSDEHCSDESSKSHELHFEKDCFACDYDMDVTTNPLSFSYRFQKPIYAVSRTEIVKQANTSFSECLTLRGPPNA